MDISTAETRLAFEECGDKMEYLTHYVHTKLFDELFERHRKSIIKGVLKIQEAHDELLIQTFIGKLRHKLPKFRWGIDLNEFDRERAQITASAIIVQCLMDGGTYSVVEKVDRFKNAAGAWQFRKLHYIQLGGSKEKDLYHGIHLEPGVVLQTHFTGWKLRADDKAFLSEVAAVPFKIWDSCSKDLLMKGFELMPDWDKRVDKYGKRLPEDPINKHNRYAIYADKVVDHVKRFPRFYLSAKYCDRDRVYYDSGSLPGMRPHGKLWETLMIDSAVPYTLTSEDERVLKHIIYVTLHGRESQERALARYTDLDYFAASEADPMAATTEEEFGNAILLNKAADALDDFAADRQSTFMFGFDFTNSGLLMSGVSYHSPEMMKATNVAGLKMVTNSHVCYGKNFGDLGLSLKEVKKLHTALLHGGTEKTLLGEIHAALGDTSFTIEQLHAVNLKAYGDCINNISTIADWGQIAVGNEQTRLRWTMPDGFKASSKAYLVGVPVDVYVASASHKEGYVRRVIVSNMPLIEDGNGFPIYDKDTSVAGVNYPVKTKKRGLYANITHSIDAYVLRCVFTACRDAGRPVLLKHDDFIAPPGAHCVILKASQDAFNVLYQSNLYQKALNEIADYSPYDLEVPTLVMGKGKNKVQESVNFLMP